MDVLVTGAFGRVGTAIIDHLEENDNYSFTFIDKERNPEYDHVVGDIKNKEEIEEAFTDKDAVVHLAASLMADPWAETLESNIKGMHNVMECAKTHNVDKFIFASSIHSVGMFEEEHAPELYTAECELKLDHTSPIRPDSYYGLSKSFGEDLGRYFIENHTYPQRFYGIRICSIRHEEHDHPYGDAEIGVKEGNWERGSTEYEEQVARLKTTWQSRRDFAHMIDRCLKDNSVTHDIFYGVSKNENRWVDIGHAYEEIGYNPSDDGAEWDSPP
jgi:nucleoside-diphosphate-sugar epimerase